MIYILFGFDEGKYNENLTKFSLLANITTQAFDQQSMHKCPTKME